MAPFRKPKTNYTRLHKISPNNSPVNVVVNVTTKSVLFDKKSRNGTRAAQAVFRVADDSGAMRMVLNNEWVDKINEGDTVALHEAVVKLDKGRMYLTVGRWTALESKATVTIKGEVKTEPDFSARVFKLSEAGEGSDESDAEVAT